MSLPKVSKTAKPELEIIIYWIAKFHENRSKTTELQEQEKKHKAITLRFSERNLKSLPTDGQTDVHIDRQQTQRDQKSSLQLLAQLSFN